MVLLISACQVDMILGISHSIQAFRTLLCSKVDAVHASAELIFTFMVSFKSSHNPVR
jgi:hypothetical protein